MVLEKPADAGRLFEDNFWHALQAEKASKMVTDFRQ